MGRANCASIMETAGFQRDSGCIERKEEMQMIQITDEAAKKFKEIAAEKDNPEEQMLRISFGGVG